MASIPGHPFVFEGVFAMKTYFAPPPRCKKSRCVNQLRVVERMAPSMFLVSCVLATVTAPQLAFSQTVEFAPKSFVNGHEVDPDGEGYVHFEKGDDLKQEEHVTINPPTDEIVDIKIVWTFSGTHADESTGGFEAERIIPLFGPHSDPIEEKAIHFAENCDIQWTYLCTVYRRLTDSDEWVPMTHSTLNVTFRVVEPVPCPLGF